MGGVVSAAKMWSRVQLTSRNMKKGDDMHIVKTVNAAAELPLYMSQN